jgi:hypothetical protein
MANSQDILLTYRTDTGEVTKSFDEIIQGLEDVDKKADDTAKKTGKVGEESKKAGKEGAKGFKILDVAMKATGIMFIVDKFIQFAGVLLENKAIAEALEVVMAAIGTIFGQLYDAARPLGEAIINAFKNPMETIRNIGKAIKENLITRFEGLLEFLPAIGNAISLVFKGKWKEAGKVAADAAGKMVLGVENITDKVSDAAEAVVEWGTTFVKKTKEAVEDSNKLTRAQQRLREAVLALNVAEAQTTAQINDLKAARDSERNSIDERIELAKEAAALEQSIADQRLAIANTRVSQIQEEIRLQKMTLEREKELADARVEAAAAAEAAGNIQVELLEFIIGLQQIRINLEDELYNEAIKREAELAAMNARTREDMAVADQAARDAEEIALLQQYDQRIAIAGDDEGLIKAATEALNADLDALNKKYADKERKRKQDNFKADLQMASNAMGALMALNEAFAGETEAEQKRAFERNKKFQIGQAIIQTAMAVTGALTAGGNAVKLATGAQFVEAAVALATGVAQVATIKKTKFGGGETGGGSVPRPTTSGATGGGGSPQLDLGFLGAGAGQTGFRTYVVSSEVSNAQQANQRINDQASLVG